MAELTIDRLKELIAFDPDTGIFRWPANLRNQSAGRQAGTIEKKGYRQIWVDGQRFKAHRLAWFYMTGAWPRRQIDHINGVKDDNRFANLREASNSQNQQNAPKNASNTSGYKCVVWLPHIGKWAARVKFPWERSQKDCGYFSNIVDAVICANCNMAYGHGEFARLNEVPIESWQHD
jgi:hypothetical protein